jgi:hypothetical protein
VAIFDAANTVDIETGALAAKRASTPAVREFGACSPGITRWFASRAAIWPPSSR